MILRQETRQTYKHTFLVCQYLSEQGIPILILELPQSYLSILVQIWSLSLLHIMLGITASLINTFESGCRYKNIILIINFTSFTSTITICCSIHALLLDLYSNKLTILQKIANMIHYMIYIY